MKKHIFGVALFSLIVIPFVYAFFYAPSIPPKELVTPLGGTRITAWAEQALNSDAQNNLRKKFFVFIWMPVIFGCLSDKFIW